MLEKKQSLFPIFVLLAFSLLLLLSLFYRVYVADRDLGIISLEKKQARLAAESGVNFALTKLQEQINFSMDILEADALSAQTLLESVASNKWQPVGVKSNSYFRITSLRKLPIDDDSSTKLIDEGLRYQILSEGRCRSHHFSTSAVIQLYDITKTFGVFSSLDEYFYGTPIQPWIEHGDTLKNFITRNQVLFDTSKLNRFGICYDAKLLYNIYAHNRPSPFMNPSDSIQIIGNYGKYYNKIGQSPSFGPFYSAAPVIVDNFVFKDDFQTALYFFKRGDVQASITKNNNIITLHSSPSLQKLSNQPIVRSSMKHIIDKDNEEIKSFIPQWRPNIKFYKELCKKTNGIYINEAGKGYQNNKPIDVDYHANEGNFYSDSYITANTSKPEQDELLKKKFVVLSTGTKYNNYNNISTENLNGAKIIFSERSVFIRGEIESDLTIVTPGHIFITGPTNIDSNLNLMLIGEQGTAISTEDLETIIINKSPSQEFIDAAREWKIKAIIYKPGAGIYTTQTSLHTPQKMNFRGLFAGKSLKLKIYGACIGGNLQRWLDNTEMSGLEIHHLTNSANRLITRPYTVNVVKLQSKPQKS